MGYRIDYVPLTKKYNQQSKAGMGRVGMTALFFSLFMVLVNLFWPEGREVLRNLILPGEQAWTAAEAFAEGLAGGETFAYAAECFCREILNHAKDIG